MSDIANMEKVVMKDENEGIPNPHALLADGFEDAFVGWLVIRGLPEAHGPIACYNYEKMVEVLVQRDGMTENEAVEFLYFNTLNAGDDGPGFLFDGAYFPDIDDSMVMIDEYNDAFAGRVECKALLQSDGVIACYDIDKMSDIIMKRSSVTKREADLYIQYQVMGKFRDQNDPAFLFRAPILSSFTPDVAEE